ncbi:hypothetical protein BKA65DRAFT_98505 [Rhexocercosporidium sp. MPI-PUGE-AT-0058]|nr:hypothetical protein BKA65DRAFT_98505 [Rhexocercosporidium sp. MPI-PUGE-AT-0058]
MVKEVNRIITLITYHFLSSCFSILVCRSLHPSSFSFRNAPNIRFARSPHHPRTDVQSKPPARASFTPCVVPFIRLLAAVRGNSHLPDHIDALVRFQPRTKPSLPPSLLSLSSLLLTPPQQPATGSPGFIALVAVGRVCHSIRFPASPPLDAGFQSQRGRGVGQAQAQGRTRWWWTR